MLRRGAPVREADGPRLRHVRPREDAVDVRDKIALWRPGRVRVNPAIRERATASDYYLLIAMLLKRYDLPEPATAQEQKREKERDQQERGNAL